ncbi:MAG: HlyC/CorC family transporter [Pseudomonadota bacterium]
MGTEEWRLAIATAALVVLLILSALFSGTETALMSVNRYRLRHAARNGNRAAALAEKLLTRPDRLIGLILLGNNAVNFSASALVTLIAQEIGGSGGVAIGIAAFTLTVLIFAEVAPKTLAAIHPERLALPAAFVYYPLLRISYPLVWLINLFANSLLRLVGVRFEGEGALKKFSRDELRTVLAESSGMIPSQHQTMLLSILDLEQMTVDDIMVPRNEIVGIDLSDDWPAILEQIRDAHHTRFPVWQDSVDNVVGMLHLRRLLRASANTELSKELVREVVDEVYYVPEGTSLNRQLINFQNSRRRLGLVVDEYGDILGMVTLQDILEEIVGEFSADGATLPKDVRDAGDGTYVVNCVATIRSLNRSMKWQLPTDGPKTLNGLILETLETIPPPGTELELAGYSLQIMQTSGSAVKTVRVLPPATPAAAAPAEALADTQD